MLFRFKPLDHQYHRECMAIAAEGLNRPIVLMPGASGQEGSWQVRQRPAAGGFPAVQAPTPLDLLDMREIAALALRERGLDPATTTWNDIRAHAGEAASDGQPAASGS